MAIPAEGVDAIKTFVIDCVLDGRRQDLPADHRRRRRRRHLGPVRASRQASRRRAPLGSRCADPEGAKLESELSRGGQPARRRPAGARRRLDRVRRARRAGGDAHHDEPGGGQHAVPFGAPRARDASRRARRRATASEPPMAHHELAHADRPRRRCARCASTTPSRCNGTLFGIRDATQIHMFDRGRTTRFDLRGHAVIHTAPNVRKVGRRRRASRPATRRSASARRRRDRMERFTRPLMEQYGVRIIIGKGGLARELAAAFRELGGVYLAIIGGTAALETTWIERSRTSTSTTSIPNRCGSSASRGFGPLLVAMDSHGGSLYDAVAHDARRGARRCWPALGVKAVSEPRARSALRTDILILGSGGAGLFAALHAHQARPDAVDHRRGQGPARQVRLHAHGAGRLQRRARRGRLGRAPFHGHDRRRQVAHRPGPRLDAGDQGASSASTSSRTSSAASSTAIPTARSTRRRSPARPSTAPCTRAI